VTGIRRDLSNSLQMSRGDNGARVSLTNLVIMSNPALLCRMILNYGVGSAEESVVRFFESYGTVVAIGKPGEGLATPGAARLYLSDDRWQDAVRSELYKAQVVLMQ